MSKEQGPEREISEGKAEQTGAPNPAISRFAQYTAPAMLAMLASAGHNTPVAAQTVQ